MRIAETTVASSQNVSSNELSVEGAWKPGQQNFTVNRCEGTVAAGDLFGIRSANYQNRTFCPADDGLGDGTQQQPLDASVAVRRNQNQAR